MEYIKLVAQIVIALGIYNVWLLRFGKTTSWRGGSATDMKMEFEAYGLPPIAVYIVGFFKLTFATLLLIGIFVPFVIRPAALAMLILMMGAVTMHIKVKDPLKKSLPAACMLMLSIIVFI